MHCACGRHEVQPARDLTSDKRYSFWLPPGHSRIECEPSGPVTEAPPIPPAFVPDLPELPVAALPIYVLNRATLKVMKELSANELRRNAEERKARLRRVFDIDRPPSAAKRRKWEREATSFLRDCPNPDRVGVYGVDIVLHCEMPYVYDPPPSEWEPTPMAYGPEQMRMIGIMKNVRKKRAREQQEAINKAVRKRESRWDF